MSPTACLALAAALLGPAVAADGEVPLATKRPSTAAGPASDTIVDGFHGYEFGTPASRIGEIDASGPPESRVDGLDVFARTMGFLGSTTRAYFYLDPATRRLRRGKHLMKPDRSTCVRQLATLRLMLAATYPELQVEVGADGRSPPAPAGARVGHGGDATRCRDLFAGDSTARRTVRFRNPASGAVEVRLELFRRGGEPRILACYLNATDCSWPDSVAFDPGPELLAPGRGPDTTDAGP